MYQTDSFRSVGAHYEAGEMAKVGERDGRLNLLGRVARGRRVGKGTGRRGRRHGADRGRIATLDELEDILFQYPAVFSRPLDRRNVHLVLLGEVPHRRRR